MLKLSLVVKEVTHHAALQEFFRDRVKSALGKQQLSVSDEVEFYLVNVLAYFSKSENLFQTNQEGKVEYRPLALKLYDSVFSHQPNERFRHLKSLGDTALYHAGFFYDGLFNQVVDVDYYINMGGSAYSSLANLSTAMIHTRKMADLFAELSEQFAALVEVLNLSCDQQTHHTDHDLLKLLDRYQKTGSKKAKGILEEFGIKTDDIKTDGLAQ